MSAASDEFLATLAGAAVAGLVGLVTLLIQQSLADRRQLREEVLGPALDFVTNLSGRSPWTSIPEPPWAALDTYHWLRIPTKYRREFKEIGKRLATHNTVQARYFEFMTETGHASFVVAFRNALAPFMGEDQASVRANAIGVDSSATIEIRLVVDQIVPYVLVSLGKPADAWSQLLASDNSALHWARALIEGLKKTDPVRLEMLFRNITNDERAVKGRELALSTWNAFVEVSDLSQPARTVLARALHVSANE